MFPVTVDPTNSMGTTSTYAKSNFTVGDHSTERLLKVGSYDDGVHTANSFLQFPTSGLDGSNASVASADLRFFITNANTCTPKPIYVSGITQAWTPPTVTTFPGPTFGGVIGGASPNVPNACANSANDPRAGDWADIWLDPALMNQWSTGATENYGLALTASSSGWENWRQILSSNNIGFEPTLLINYSGVLLPQIKVQSPPDGFAAPTLTPTLTAFGTIDPSLGQSTRYIFQVQDAAGDVISDSGTLNTGSFTVPAGKLKWGEQYAWTVEAWDGTRRSPAVWRWLSPTIPQPLITSGLSQNGSGRGFDPATGNYTTEATDADIETVGPTLDIVRNYNSRDPRTSGAFGAAWSAVPDAQAVEQKDPDTGVTQSVTVTYPDGSTVGYGKNTNGTFSPPEGRFATFASVTGGYTLTDKNSTVYKFTHEMGTGSGIFGLTSITDANGRALTLTWTNGHVTKETSASGRSMNLEWSTPADATSAHVNKVYSDPAVPGDLNTAQTWLYTYSGDKLTQVCALGCTQYSYTNGSLHHSQVLNNGPQSFWPLAEAAGSTVAKSAVLSNGGSDNGTYSEVTLGQPGPLTSGAATAAGFNGTTSMVMLPRSTEVGIAPAETLAMWFKTTTAGGVLYSYQQDQVSPGATTVGDYSPALYVGTDGKLRGILWMGSVDPITTANAVTDGNWHHVALSATGASQSMYLDGALVGSRTGLIKASGQLNDVVGAGFIGGGWPSQPYYSNTNVTGHASFFNGSIANVAVFGKPLNQADITGLYSSATRTTSLMKTITSRAGKAVADVTYDPVTAEVSKAIDKNGGTWEISPPTVSGSSKVFRSAVLGAWVDSYYRFGEGGAATQAANEINAGQGTYANTTLGVEGPFTDSTAASFNGTSSYVELPSNNQVQTSSGSVEMWFKMPAGNTAGGVLFSQQYNAQAGATPADYWGYVPALYVGTDGKLHGKFWDTNGTNNGLTSGAVVNDGKWHHVALAAGTNAQTLYLDGVDQGSTNAALVTSVANHVYVGAGMAGGTWPSHPTNVMGWFPGSISEVAFYRHQLSAQDVTNQFGAAKNSNGPALVKTITIKDPGGKFLTQDFDPKNGSRQLATTDSMGNRTTYGYDSGGYLRTTTDPGGNVEITGQDARGNKVSETTCQDHEANICSTSYYSYWPDSTTTQLTPNPKNDVQLTVRDGRSTSPTDDWYLTVNEYDDKGNQTAVVTSPAPGFPGGRFTRTYFTDGTTIAAADGGFAPPGLPYKTVLPDNATSTTTYFKSGDVATTTDSAGLVTTFTYDGLGRALTKTTVSDTYPAGLTESYKYDYLGRVVEQLSPPVTNRVTGAVHQSKSVTVNDLDGNVTSQTVSDLTGGDASRTTFSTYDGHGMLASRTDQLGNVKTFGYDSYGNKITETTSSGQVLASTYDANGHLLTKVLKGYIGDPNNPSPAHDLVQQSRAYDPAGRVASITDAVGSTMSYTYTDNHLVASVTKTDPTGVKKFVEKATTYDAAGNPIKEVTNNGATTTTFALDNASRVISTVLDPGGTNRITNVSYTPNDLVATTTGLDGGGWPITTAYTYDAMGRKTSESITGDNVGHPVGWWKMNQNSGSTVTDASGTGQTASVSNSVTWDSDDSASFPGTTGSQITTNGPVVDTSQSFSVSAWVKLSSVPARNVTAVSQDGNRKSGFQLQYSDYRKKWNFVRHRSDTDNAQGDDAISTTNAAAGVWTHLIGTFNSATGQTKLYVNGAQEGTATATTPWNATGPLAIGRGQWNGSATDFFPGSISNVQVYNRLLSNTEATGLYTSGRTGGTTASTTKATTKWTLDKQGLAIAMTDPNGNTTNYANDEAGRQTSVTSPTVNTEVNGGTALPQRPTELIGYNTFGEKTEEQDANGNTTTTVFDVAGHKIKETNPPYTAPGSSTAITASTVWTYTSDHQEQTKTDPLGNVTRTEYDQLGKISKSTDARGGVSTTTYTATGLPLISTTANGAQSQKTYDYLGRELTSTFLDRYPTAVASISTNSYTSSASNPGGAFLASETQGGKTTVYEYNKIGEKTAITDASGAITHTQYDQKGRPTKVINADGTATATQYDLLDNPTSVQELDSDGTVLTEQTTTYDAAGNSVSTTDPRGFTTSQTRDANGRITSQTEPVSANTSITVSFGYAANGDRTRYTDGRGNIRIDGFNSWNLQESILEPATTAYTSDADRRSVITYDANGHTVKTIQPGSVTTTAGYDQLGRLTSQTGTGADADTASRTFTYDADGRMLTASTDNIGTQVEATSETFTYNDHGQILTSQGSAGSSSHSYNADGQPTSQTSAAGTTAITYDAAGRPATLNDGATNTTLTYGYDVSSQVTSINYGTGKTRDLTYDKLQHVTSDTLKTSSGTSIASVSSGYDKTGNLTSKNTTGVIGASANTYTYDRNNRLISWNDGTQTTAYEYDANSNRTKVGTAVYSYDTRDQLTSDGQTSYSYTARGTFKNQSSGAVNVTSSSDAFSQKITDSAIGSATRTYLNDALGRNLKATGGSSGNQTFTYIGTKNTATSDGANTYSRDSDDNLIGIGVTGGPASAATLALTDAHDDVIANFTETGTSLIGSTTYDPFGKPTGTTGMQGRLGYQSGWTDPATNKVNMWSRWYNPATGQFQDKDTLDVSAILDSGAANAFAYIAGNPMTGTDPDGHMACLSRACRGEGIIQSQPKPKPNPIPVWTPSVPELIPGRFLPPVPVWDTVSVKTGNTWTPSRDISTPTNQITDKPQTDPGRRPEPGGASGYVKQLNVTKWTAQDFIKARANMSTAQKNQKMGEDFSNAAHWIQEYLDEDPARWIKRGNDRVWHKGNSRTSFVITTEIIQLPDGRWIPRAVVWVNGRAADHNLPARLLDNLAEAGVQVYASVWKSTKPKDVKAHAEGAYGAIMDRAAEQKKLFGGTVKETVNFFSFNQICGGGCATQANKKRGGGKERAQAGEHGYVNRERIEGDWELRRLRRNWGDRWFESPAFWDHFWPGRGICRGGKCS